jgi:hypothetical protein
LLCYFLSPKGCFYCSATLFKISERYFKGLLRSPKGLLCWKQQRGCFYCSCEAAFGVPRGAASSKAATRRGRGCFYCSCEAAFGVPRGAASSKAATRRGRGCFANPKGRGSKEVSAHIFSGFLRKNKNFNSEETHLKTKKLFLLLV